MLFNKQPILAQNRRVNDKCKIEIKRTKTGKALVFSPNCSKEQMELAKEHFKENTTDDF